MIEILVVLVIGAVVLGTIRLIKRVIFSLVSGFVFVAFAGFVLTVNEEMGMFQVLKFLFFNS